MDKNSRSIAKAITWRIIGTIVLASVTYLITGSLKHMTMITIIFEFIQLLNYYWHERVWMKIKWGKILHPLQQLPVSKEIAPQHMEVLRMKLEEWGYLDKNSDKKISLKKKAITRRRKASGRIILGKAS